jgi:hypothetical protein
MSKAIFRTVLILIVILAAAVVLTDMFLGQIVKSGFNKYAPSSVGTDTRITGATLSPLSGAGALEGLTVANPKGWSDPKALSAGKVRVEMETSSIFSDTVVINELVIEDVSFNYETRFLTSNIGDLLANANNASKTDSATPQPQSHGQSKKFVIQRLRITNAKVKIGVGPSSVTLPVSTIELTNIGSGKGVSAPELTAIILRVMLEGLAKASVKGAGHLGSAVTGAAGAAAQGVLNSIDKALGKKQ